MQIIENIQYGNEPVALADLYLPGENNNSMLILYLHGGGWSGGTRKEAVNWAQIFQAMGYTFASMDYQLADGQKQHAYPKQMDDIEQAITFFKAKSTGYRFDPGKIIIMGSSAGSQLAFLYANKHDSVHHIKAAILMSGVFDLADSSIAPAALLKFASAFIGQPMNEGSLKAVSPWNYISDKTVPACFIHGEADELVPVQQSTRTYEKLKTLQVPALLRILPSYGHYLFNADMRKEFANVDLFLKENLK